MPKKFKTIVCDPPWGFPRGWLWQRKVSRSREHYPVLTVEQMMKLPVPKVAMKNGFLWLWVPSYHINAGDHIRVLDAWGYRPVGQLVWVKTKATEFDFEPGDIARLIFKRTRKPVMSPEDLVRIGLGLYLRGSHETAILGVRGKNNRFKVRDVPSVLFAPPEGHSVKPQPFYAIVERACRGPRLDLFARNGHRDGWTEWGLDTKDTLGWGFDPEAW